MVGGGSKREEGSLMISNTNVFAALDTLKKKKKSDKDRKSKVSSNSKSQGGHSKESKSESEPHVFWAPAPLNAKSWADVDDDDDYFATTAPPQSVWSVPQSSQHSDEEKPENFEESESEEDILDEGDDDAEDDHEDLPEHSVNPETEVKKHNEVSAAPKEAERQLSKKERKKKELAELDALLADLGVTQKESNDQDGSQGAPQDKKGVEADGDGEKKENITSESKNAKKKKKKDKASKEAKESQDQPNSTDMNNGPDDVIATENVEDTSTVDVKERLKKVASMKKKKSSKEMDAAARAAAQEAAARNARLAAAKKKEKNHYNQQPLR